MLERITKALERLIESHRRPTFTEHADALVRLIREGKAAGTRRIQETSFMGVSIVISFEGDKP